MKKKISLALAFIVIFFAISFDLGKNYIVKAEEKTDFVVGTQNLNNTPDNSAKVGDQLTYPEKGWKRYDDTYKGFNYSNFSQFSNGIFYKGQTKLLSKDESVSFRFYGSKFRIFSAILGNRSSKCEVEIDGKSVETFSQSIENLNHPTIGQRLSYEKLNMELTTHNVKITNKDEGSFEIDAIEIDDVGEIKEALGKGTTWNPNENSQYCTLTNNRLTASIGNNISGVRATNYKTSGKWYWEVSINEESVAALGVANDNPINITGNPLRYDNAIVYYGENGNIYKGNEQYGERFGAGDVIGIALDIESQKITFYKNNKSQGEKNIPNIEKYYPFYENGGSWRTSKVTANFGSQQFKYTPPTGFMPFDNENINNNLFIKLNTDNLNLLEGDSDKIIATVLPKDATNKKVTWSSSDESIATVDQEGNVKALKVGQATITAKLDGTELTATCKVNVTKPVIENKNNAILSISLVNGATKEYDVSMEEVDKFINWFEERANGKGPATYAFNKKISPYKTVKEYIVHDKIVSFEVREYEGTK
nr:Ig-like domain-containing protein [Clostridium hydrogeniformans]